jgi:signal transduction histidine kinase
LAPLTYDETTELIAKEAADLMKADWVGLYLADKNELKQITTFPKGSNLFVPRKNGLTYRAYKEKKTFMVDEKQIEVNHPELKGKGLKLTVCIPLSYHKKSIGALTFISSKLSKLSDDELDSLKIFGSYASLAIRKAENLQQMNEALQLRDNFISIAAHELRTPLTTINGYIQLLHNRVKNVSDEQMTKWFNQLLWESRRFTLLVNELLEINRIKAGKFIYDFKECSLREIAQRAVDNFQLINPTKTIVFNDKVGKNSDTIIADYDKLLQVISNLLENAIKYSPPNEKILVNLKYDPSYLILEVADKGRGIPKEELPKIFQGILQSKKCQRRWYGFRIILSTTNNSYAPRQRWHRF